MLENVSHILSVFTMNVVDYQTAWALVLSAYIAHTVIRDGEDLLLNDLLRVCSDA